MFFGWHQTGDGVWHVSSEGPEVRPREEMDATVIYYSDPDLEGEGEEEGEVMRRCFSCLVNFYVV